MAIVRLRHPDLRDVTFVVLHDRLYEDPYFCPSCRVTHVHKAYHLRLNSEGETTVSRDVYERLAELKNLPLKKVSRDRKPQPQVLLMPGAEQAPIPSKLEEAARWALHAQKLPSVLPPEVPVG